MHTLNLHGTEILETLENGDVSNPMQPIQNPAYSTVVLHPFEMVFFVVVCNVVVMMMMTRSDLLISNDTEHPHQIYVAFGCICFV